jgi:multidrug efflux pump subunit AcrA (membrane-fusion protein)
MYYLTLLSLALVAADPPTAGPSSAPRTTPPNAESDATVEVPSMLIKIDEEVEVPAREAGVLAAVNVREGQMVEPGAWIAQIEDDEARIAAERAKIEMAIAKANAENDVGIRFARKSLEVSESELHRSAEALERYAKSISASEMDRLRLLVDKNRVEIEQAEHEFKVAGYTRQVKAVDYQAAQQAISRRKITAPLGGVVVQVLRHRGEWVKPGDPVVRIVSLDHLRAEGFLQSRYLAQKLDGRKVRLIVDLPGDPAATFPGKIVFLDPEIDPVNAQVHLRVDVVNQGLRLRPGMRAKMQFEASR